VEIILINLYNMIMWAENQIALEKNYAVGSYLFIIFYSTGMYLFIYSSLHLPIYTYSHFIYLGHPVTQFVEVLHYKPEFCGFNSRWCH
jgi:hypothetical protein